MIKWNLNLPIGVYTLTPIVNQPGIYCQIKHLNEQGETTYTTRGTFTNCSDNCIATVTIGLEAGTEIENAKFGCMLNAGDIALPFSEYTDVAVI